MSRCFPFPPPGYEKKAIIDDTDLLAKEKRKDKRHKKDKKDKEKKEGKEKKDKDISKEKHREKKERKEKHKDKDRDKEKNQITDEKRVEGQPWLQNGEKVGPNSLQNEKIKDSRFVLELSKRIREDNKASGSQFIQKTTATDQRRAELPGRAVDSRIGKQLKEQEKIKEKNEDHRKVNDQRNHIDTRGMEKTLGQNFSGVGREKVDGIARLVEDTGKQTEENEKGKCSKSDNKDNKHKHRDQEKHQASKDKELDNEKKKEEKAREITEPTKEHPKLKESCTQLKESSKDSLDFRITKTPETLKLSSTSYAGEGNLGKRKEPEMNGYIPDNGPLPSKFQRTIPSSNLFIVNGRKLEPCQTVLEPASGKQGPVSNHRLDVKEHKINGLIAAPHLDACPTRPPANILANENGEMYRKPPHPDEKYLGRILSVPGLDTLPDSSDQEWLSNSNHLQTEKLESSFPGVDGTQQVWAEALQIDSADIVALPYVIPY